MFKKCISLLLVCLVVTSVFMIVPVDTKAVLNPEAYGETVYKTNGIQYIIEDNEATIVGYTGTSKSVTLPSSLNGYTVTRIGHRYANFLGDFMPGFENVTSVTIPGTVRIISTSAFAGAVNLTSVDFGSELVEIGWSAFYGCSKLKTFDIPDSVVFIGSGAFDNTAWYNNQPNGLIYLKNTLYDYKGEIPANYTLKIKDGTTSVSVHAFWGGTNIVNIVAPDSLCLIGSRAFYNTTWYNNQKDGPIYLGKVLYSYKGMIPSHFTIKEGTVGIAGEAFFDGEPSFMESVSSANLKSVTIPDSVKYIGSAAFSNCCNLSELHIPRSVSYIGEKAYGFHQAYKGDIVKAPADEYPIKVVGYVGTAAEKYAKEYNIEFESAGGISGLEIYSNYTNLTVELGDTINIGAGIFKNDSQVTDVSKVTCSVYDHSILSVKSTTVKDNRRFYEFNTHSVGTTYVTFSDSNTGYTKRVPVTVCDTKDSAYTVSNIPTVKIGDYTANFYNSNGLYIDNYNYTTASDGKTTVKFDVYNHNYIYGAVEVYNSNGVLTDAIVIDKMTNLKGSIKETVWDGPYYLVEDIIEGDIFTYKETISSKHTPVEVVIPKDGYIKITTDTINSNLVALLNGIDIAMGLKGVVGEIKGFDTNSKFFAEKITKEIVNNAIYAELAKDENKFAKDLMKGFVKKTTIFSTKSMGSFVDSFVNNLSELKLEKLIFDTAVDFGWSTSEDLFQYFAGPIGMAMKGLFAAGDAANVIIQCKHLDDRMYCGNICIQNQSGGTRISSQVTVKSDTNFDSNTAFRVYEVAIDSSEFEIVKELNPQLYEEITSMPSVIYNIAMIKDGKETQLNGKVEVVIPIPDEMKHLERSNGIVVYRIEEDGTKTEMIVEVRDGNLVFRTDHFSLYVISADVFGDTDSDGEVSIMDATAIQLHIAKISSLSTHQINNADTDGDGEVSIMDATEIQLFVAKLIPALGECESITLSSTQLTMNVGDKKTLTATVKPSSLSNTTVTWSSSNSSIVSVVNGVVEAKGLGTATITAKTKSGVTAKCTITVKDKTIEVSSIKLNSNGISLNEGNTYQLVATVLPENATNKSLTWSTNNPSVATVSSSGKITAVSIGKATITAKSSNGVTITCAVSVVPIQVSSITLSDTNEVLYLGFTHFLTATVKPDNANDKSLTWSSSNTSVVTVSSSGAVTAKGLGTATVAARASNGVSASCVFTVCDILPDSLTVSKNTQELDVGQSFQLTGTITPSYATNKTITWSSSDTSVATVTQSGNVKAVGSGKATITAKTVNGIKAVCEITSYTPVSGTYELFLKLRKNPAGCYRLTADDTLNTLDLNIDTFTGCINGDGHTITITYDSTSKNVINNCYKALLPKTDGAVIKNLNISGTIDHEMYSDGSYSNYCAGFVAYAENTTFVNCTNEAMVKSTIWSNYSGYGYVGGITAWSNNCNFTDCTNKGGLQATTMPVKVASSIAGGISGQSSGCKFDCCSNSGNVYAHSSNSSDTYYSISYSGGIVGSSNSSELKMCVTSGNMMAYAWPDYETYYTSVAASGGIIAYGNGKIENCSSSCKLNPSATNGGVIYKGDSIAYKN